MLQSSQMALKLEISNEPFRKESYVPNNSLVATTATNLAPAILHNRKIAYPIVGRKKQMIDTHHQRLIT